MLTVANSQKDNKIIKPMPKPILNEVSWILFTVLSVSWLCLYIIFASRCLVWTVPTYPLLKCPIFYTYPSKCICADSIRTANHWFTVLFL